VRWLTLFRGDPQQLVQKPAAWEGLGHLGTSEVGEALERLVRRIERSRVGEAGTSEAIIDPRSVWPP
jgi:hypothetical protein